MQPLFLEELMAEDAWLRGFPGGAPSCGRLIESSTCMPYSYLVESGQAHSKLWAWPFNGRTVVSHAARTQFGKMVRKARLRFEGVESALDRFLILSELTEPAGAEELIPLIEQAVRES
jgi:hypothetical protein